MVLICYAGGNGIFEGKRTKMRVYFFSPAVLLLFASGRRGQPLQSTFAVPLGHA